MSVREIQAFLVGTYGTEVSPELISAVTDQVVAEAAAWQSWPLERMYPIAGRWSGGFVFCTSSCSRGTEHAILHRWRRKPLPDAQKTTRTPELQDN